MTYYPPPSSLPPGSPFQPPSGPLGYGYPFPRASERIQLARRASVALFIVAGMGLLCGVFFGFALAFVPSGELVKNMAFEPPPGSGLSNEQFIKMVCAMGAILCMVGGIMLAIFAGMARRGSTGAIIAAMVTSILILLWMGLNVLSGLLSGPMMALGVACMAAIPGTPLVLGIIWLWRALQSNRTGGGVESDWQLQYRMLQQQAGHTPQSYGYGYAPPPAAPIPPSPQQSLGPLPRPPGEAAPKA